MPNLATSPIVVPADPNVEGVGSGMNGAACNPGIGIATDNPDPKVQDWSEDTIDPAPGQYLGWGGDSVETGQEAADVPPLVLADYVTPDFNDTAVFAQADGVGPYVTGAVYNAATGAVNRGAQDILANEWAWGGVPVA